MDCFNKTENINDKRLMLPISATFSFENNTCGYPVGKICVTVDLEFNSITHIIPFWADNNGKLKDYNSLYNFKITNSTTIFVFDPCIIIPHNATRLLLYSFNCDTLETTENYYEIALPNQVISSEDFGEQLFEFQVISDVQLQSDNENSNYINALKKICNTSPLSLGIFIVGDLTNNGRISEYEKHNEIYKMFKDAPNCYLAIGNHDFYDGGQAQTEILKKRFLSYAKLPDGSSPNSSSYDFWINGYHFVILGIDGITSDLLSATYTDETMLWLKNKLSENRDFNRPTFLFSHFTVQRTTAGSFDEYTVDVFTGVYGDNAKKIKDVLKDFPEVIMFTGHQHLLLGFPKTIHPRTDELPTIFNTASISMVSNCIGGRRVKGNGSEGYFVYVYKDKLVVKGYDFKAEKWIPSAYFCVDFNV